MCRPQQRGQQAQEQQQQQAGLDLLCQAFSQAPEQPGVLNLLAAHSLAQGDYAQVCSCCWWTACWKAVLCSGFYTGGARLHDLTAARSSQHRPHMLHTVLIRALLQAKALAQSAMQLTDSPALQTEARVCLARAHHACRELQDAQRLYTAVRTCFWRCRQHSL